MAQLDDGTPHGMPNDLFKRLEVPTLADFLHREGRLGDIPWLGFA
jgi:hypothetical protein